MNIENFSHESIDGRNVRLIRHPGFGCRDGSLVLAWHLAWHGGSAVCRTDIWAFWNERSQGSHGPGIAAVRLLDRLKRWAKFFSHLSQARDAVCYIGACRRGH